MKEKKMFFKECHLAGRQYYDADEVWEELHVGLPLVLEREADNRYDPDAVAVIYCRKAKSADVGERFKLGYIPSSENRIFSVLMDMDWGGMFECRISRISPDEHYENQVRLTIRVKRRGLEER